MTDRVQIENQIRELLATETRSTALSNKLFQQGIGLFSRLGATEAERREIAKMPLFREAQMRIRELERRDAEALNEVVKVIAERFPDRDFSITLDPQRSHT